MTDGLGVTTFEQFARASPSPNAKTFLEQMQCTVCLDPLRLSDAVCCWQCKVPTHVQCAATRSHSATRDPPCLVCKDGVMSPSAGFLQGFRMFDGQMQCGICNEELPGWDNFCDHYDTCLRLPAQPCCRPCLHPQTGTILLAACTATVAREELEEHRRLCPIRQACRTARRLVHGAVKQHETAQKTHAGLETKLAQVQCTSSMPTRAPILTLIALSSFEPFGQAYHQVEGLETEKAEALKALDSERALSRQNLGALRAALQRADEERKAMDSNEWNLQRATNPAFIEEAIKQWLSAGGRGRPSTLDTAALAGALVLNLVPDVPPYQRRHSMRKRGSDDRDRTSGM